MHFYSALNLKANDLLSAQKPRREKAGKERQELMIVQHQPKLDLQQPWLSLAAHGLAAAHKADPSPPWKG